MSTMWLARVSLLEVRERLDVEQRRDVRQEEGVEQRRLPKAKPLQCGLVEDQDRTHAPTLRLRPSGAEGGRATEIAKGGCHDCSGELSKL